MGGKTPIIAIQLILCRNVAKQVAPFCCSFYCALRQSTGRTNKNLKMLRHHSDFCFQVCKKKKKMLRHYFDFCFQVCKKKHFSKITIRIHKVNFLKWELGHKYVNPRDVGYDYTISQSSFTGTKTVSDRAFIHTRGR